MKTTGRYLVGVTVAAVIAGGSMLLVYFKLLEPAQARFTDQRQARLKNSLEKISGLLQRDLQQRLRGLLETARADEILVALARTGNVDEANLNVAADWMKISGLSVMTLADSQGRILSCGHLSGSAGERDVEIVEMASRRRASGIMRLAVRQGGEIHKVLALVAVVRRDLENTGLLLLGGWRLDGELLCGLQQLSGTSLRLIGGNGEESLPECEPGRQQLLSTEAGYTWRMPWFDESCPREKRFWLQVTMPGQRVLPRWEIMAVVALLALFLAVTMSWLLGKWLNRNR